MQFLILVLAVRFFVLVGFMVSFHCRVASQSGSWILTVNDLNWGTVPSKWRLWSELLIVWFFKQLEKFGFGYCSWNIDAL